MNIMDKNPASSRVMMPMARREMERRWKLVRDRLKEKNLQALIVFNMEDYLGAHVKWLTDRPVVHAYPAAVIFHADDLMTSIEHGNFGNTQKLDGNDPEHPGIGEILSTASFHSAHYTKAYEAELALGVLKARGYTRVAVAGWNAAPHGFVQHMVDNAGVEFVDETDFIDWAKAVKSADEIAAIRATCAMQDSVFEKILPQIKPGMRDMDVMALAQYEGRKQGSEQAVFLFGSESPGKAAMHRHLHYQNRTLKAGDALTILIENNGPSGYYGELGRNIVLGKAPAELLDACAKSAEAQANTVAMFKPGMPAKEIHRKHNEYLASKGRPGDKRLYSHGQGYALVERPLIRHDETMSLEKGMFLVCHPGWATEAAFGFICDNYLVEESGPSQCLHKTPKKVFELG